MIYMLVWIVGQFYVELREKVLNKVLKKAPKFYKFN